MKTARKAPRATNLSDRRRDRAGKLVKECEHCTCPDGCLCSPSNPCPCGSTKAVK